MHKRVSGVSIRKVSISLGRTMSKQKYLDVEDLEVYKKLCELHINVCDLTRAWPQEEKYELGSQARRSSNSASI